MAFEKPAPPPPQVEKCARCGQPACWHIWSHPVCVSCANAWDDENINSDFQARTDAWVKAGKP